MPDRCPAELPVGLYRTCEVYRTLQRRDMDIDNRDDCKLTDVTYTTRFTQCIITSWPSLASMTISQHYFKELIQLYKPTVPCHNFNEMQWPP